MYAYGFTAFFTDGSFLNQGDDVGKIRGGSAFSDLVIIQERGKILEALSLISEEHEVSVLLAAGTFSIDNDIYLPGEEVPDFCEWRTELREMPPGVRPAPGGYEHAVIYYRRNIVHAIEGAVPEITHFCLGYECRGVKTVLGVKP